VAILEVTLNTGRKIWASMVYIEDTYAGLLEGYPISRLNDRVIARLPQRAAGLFGDWPVHVIEPARYTKEATHPTPFGPPEYLPSCWIGASFTSLAISDAKHASQLIVVWFQEEAFPVPAESALELLQAMAWERLACDFEY
jgi:hypothetical protein